MSSNTEKARRKAIVHAIQDKEEAEAFARKPIPNALLLALFDHLETTLFESHDGKIHSKCDHTLNVSRAFLRSAGVENVEEVMEWFGEYGGFCDCEISYNVTDYWYDRLKKRG
jgi:hypothetical protein